MTKYKTEDYKYSAVKYYLNNEKGDGYKKTCKIFDCKKSTLRDWIKRYNISKNLTTTKIYMLCNEQTLLIYNFTERCGFKSSRV